MNAGINHFHQTPDREWFETDAVLRVSLGNFLFFSILSLLMVGVKTQKDPRDSLHHGGWMMKVICWCVLVILMFFLPNEIISFYGSTLIFVTVFNPTSQSQTNINLFCRVNLEIRVRVISSSASRPFVGLCS